jgi:TolB-like protein
MLALAATFAVPGVMLAQGDNRPVVVVFRFDNGSVGPGRADYDGMATGVQDLLITDLASNTKIRLVDRAHLNEVLAEQNLSKTGQVDPTTAVRIGKILGAQYAVTGGFMSDGSGSAMLTGRTIDIETTQIINPQKIQGKTTNVLGLITDLSSKIASNMNLAPKPGAGRRSDDNNGGSAQKTSTSQSGTATKSAASAPATEVFAQASANPDKMRSTKLDAATMKIYSNALDEMDKKNYPKAKELLLQVRKNFPDFEPASRNLDKISKIS